MRRWIHAELKGLENTHLSHIVNFQYNTVIQISH